MVKKVKSIFKEDSILKRIALSLIIVMIVQSTFIYGVIFLGGTVDKLYYNSLDILNEKIKSRRSNVEDIMVNNIADIELTAINIKKKVNQYIKDKSISYSEFIGKSKTYDDLLDNVSEDLVYMMRKNQVNGAFLILNNGNKDYPKKGEKLYNQGVYIMDADPKYNENENKDLLLLKGPSSISKSLGIKSAPSWSTNICFDGNGYSKNLDYFYKPLNGVANHKNMSIRDLGYWSPAFQFENSDLRTITYSAPIIGDGGEVIGILGVSITDAYLSSFLPYIELGSDEEISYLLGAKREDKAMFTNIVASGEWFRNSFTDKENVSYRENGSYRGYKVFPNDSIEDEAYGLIEYLNIYSSNSPFENEKWALIGLTHEEYLFSFVMTLKKHIINSIVASTVLSAIFIFLASKMIVNPMILLSKNIRRSRKMDSKTLERVGIREIDDLSMAIEELRENVAEYSSKLANITNMADYYISAFEYKRESKKVFVTNNFFDIFSDTELESKNNYIDRKVFVKVFDYLKDNLEEVLDDNITKIYKVKDKNKNDMWIKVKIADDGAKVFGVILDITSEYVNRKKIEYERDYDILTNLRNRRAFNNIVDKMFKNNTQGKIAAMIMIDLDNLKHVNDTYGHDYGDKYICLLGKILKKLSSSQILAARMSGDEFYLFIHNKENEDEVRKEIEILKKEIENSKMNLPYGGVMRLRLSGGIAWYPKDSGDYKELIKFADFAMYTVKNTTKGQLADFDYEKYKKDGYIITGKEELNKIIDEKLINYKFQPIVSVKSGEIYGYEALMRPVSDIIKSPAELIEIAKSQSKLYQIEKITFFKSLEKYTSNEDSNKYKIFINSVSNQVLSSYDTDMLEEMYGDYLKNIVIEITENEKVDDTINYVKQKCIETWGAEVALDDFGSGYNGESTLLTIFPRFIKVDKSITIGIDEDENRQSIFESIVIYAKKKNIFIIAEGVETKSQMEKLISYGADYLQGYYVGRPHEELKGIDKKIIKEILEIKNNMQS